MKALSHGFALLRSLALMFVLAGVATWAMAAKTYSDNGDGTVTDPTTELVWMRCSMGQVWDGTTCTGTAKTYKFDVANALTGTVTFAKKSDWRLPNIRELLSLVDWSIFGPAIDAAAFPNSPQTGASRFWSSTTEAHNSGDAWLVNIYYGIPAHTSQGSYGHVRMVRSSPPIPSLLDIARPDTDYVDHADGTVTHTPTGLMWQRCAWGQTWTGRTCSNQLVLASRVNALQMCSSFAGYMDWRMPTVEELLSLADYTSVALAINTVMFPGTSNAGYISSTPGIASSISTWGVGFGTVTVGTTNGSGNLRFVRNARSLGEIHVCKGWNLLGNGTDQPLTMATLVGDQASSVITVWKWDVAQTGWQFYTPSMDATALQTYATNKNYAVLSQVNAGEGFWVNAAKAFSVTLPSGTAITASDFQDGWPLAMKNGWNLVAIGNALSPSVFNVAISATPPTAGVVPLNLTTLWAWDNFQSQWYFYAPNLESQSGTVLTDYIANKGYLDFTATHKFLRPGMGFWVNKP